MGSMTPVSRAIFSASAHRLFRVSFLCVAILLACMAAFSQANQGRILGTIADQSGGVLVGATVTVVDVERGLTRTLTTDQAGLYDAPSLLPGNYAVRAAATGFKTLERQNLLLEVGKEIRVDLTLQTGEQTQTVTVVEALPLVEATNATLGGTLSNQTINDLPLNGRNYINLLTLRPGMNVYPGGGGSTRSANGTRTEDIGYLLDGLREDDPYTGSSVLNAAIAAGDSSTSLPIDAIQEFNTEQNPKAEFGWKPGAIVNAGLKSGTNGIHGTAFAFGRDTSFDALNYFDGPPLPAAPVALEQFGGSIGGPMKKDKLFYFANYEGQRYSVGSTLLVNAPTTVSLATPSKPAGNPAQSLVDACNAVGRANVTPLSAQLAGLPAGSCTPNAPNYTPGPSESFFPTNTGTAPIILGLVSINSQNNGVAKVDYHLSDHHSFSGMYFHGVGGGYWNDGAYQLGLPGSSNSPFMSSLFGYIQAGSGAWTWTPNSTVVNQLRVGYVHFRQYYDSIDSNVNPLKYGINTGVTDPRFFGFPFIRINPFSSGNFRLGGNWPKHTGPDHSLEFLENLSILHGKHSFKFGGDVIFNSADPFITTNGKGSFRFTNLTNFLRGNLRTSGTLSAILAGDPARQLTNQQYAVYGQDDWRVTPRLMVNLGLRYELTTVPTDANNKLGNFDPTAGLVQVGHGESAAFQGDHNNFSPRLGFAWDLRGDGKTVIRGGGSIMYEQLPFTVFIAVANALGLNQVPTGASTVVKGVITPGIGNMGVLSESVSGTVLSPGWKAQTAACISGGTTACGSIFPANIFALQCGDGLVVPADPIPCNTEAVNPNLETPYVGTWTLTLQRAITNNLSLEVAYVGNHGTKFLGFQDINQPALGSGFTPAQIAAGDPSAASIKAEQLARPFNAQFPYLAQIDQLSNMDHSNYHALQVTATQRVSHGLSFLAGYTYAHALDNASGNFNANALPPDSHNPTAVYANSDFDIQHRFTFTTTWLVPGRKTPGQTLEGWQLNSVVTLQTGAPWSPRDLTDDFSGTGAVSELNSFGQLWNFSGNAADFQSTHTPIPCWGGSGGNALSGCTLTTEPQACVAAATALGANTLAALNSVGCYTRNSSVLIPPALGTIGNAGRNVFRDSGFKNWDVSVIKDWKIRERLTTQFRAEFFNVLNHPNFTNPGGPAGAGFNDPSSPGSFACGCNTPDQGAPNPVLGTGANRSIQLGLKLIF